MATNEHDAASNGDARGASSKSKVAPTTSAVATAAAVPATNETQDTGFPLAKIMIHLAIAYVAMSMFSGLIPAARSVLWSVPVTPLSFDQASAPVPSVPGQIVPAVRLGSHASVALYLSLESSYNRISPNERVWAAEFTYGTWEVLTANLTIPIPDAVRLNNASYYAHLVAEFDAAPRNIEVLQGNHGKGPTIYRSSHLTRFMPKVDDRKVYLLGGGGSDSNNVVPDLSKHDDKREGPKVVAYWWPNITIAVVNTDENLPLYTPPLFMNDVVVTPRREYYLPIVFFNDFWMLREDLHEINSSTTNLNLTVNLQPMTSFKFKVFKQFGQSFQMQEDYIDINESETMKKMLLKTNPVLFVVTIIVSLLRSVFDFLAFKNDIQFWRKKKDMEGMSFRSLALNFGFQVVIYLYLLDNDTSYVVLVSNGLGILIEAWKLQRIAKIETTDKFPYIVFEDKAENSTELSEKTHEYDAIAFRYVAYALYPCLFLYMCYSLMYSMHKSWYSFILSTVVGFIYAFGFISMTPQLYINYKLKSVAHMPWRTFIYKALNTFIDDLFAFVIEMPMLHRLACLRDDVVFVIYLYQKWIYPEDKTRVNEYGQVGESNDEEKDDVQPLTITKSLVEKKNE